LGESDANDTFIFFTIVHISGWINNRRGNCASFIVVPRCHCLSTIELYTARHAKFFPPLISANFRARHAKFFPPLISASFRQQWAD